LYFKDGETLIDNIMELEDSVRYQSASDRASALSWVSWDKYTPRVFDELAKITADPKVLPVLMPLQS
jgi:hypothetical protein